MAGSVLEIQFRVNVAKKLEKAHANNDTITYGRRPADSRVQRRAGSGIVKDLAVNNYEQAIYFL